MSSSPEPKPPKGYLFDRSFTFNEEYPSGLSPSKKIGVVQKSKESTSRPHDLILISDKYGVGKSQTGIKNGVLIGTFPNRKSALLKKKDMLLDYKIRNQNSILSQSSWDVDQEFVVKPSSL
mmetsp:Transcript_1615/g.2567  ORF Transcript_1615/g.2567 Transcript_1615/m.2567 type:complete len:121 (+) Transcript_1615:63-425(+)